MERLLKGLSRLRDWALPPAPDAAGLDPTAGRALARSLAEELAAHAADLAAVDAALVETRAALSAAEARERHLGDRIYRYREELRERRAALDEAVPALRACDDDEEQDGLLDEENPYENDAQELRDIEEHARLVQEWQRDSQTLERAIQNQKMILMYCESVRRQLRTLEANRQKFEEIQCSYKVFMSLNGIEELIGRDEHTDHGMADNATH